MTSPVRPATSFLFLLRSVAGDKEVLFTRLRHVTAQGSTVYAWHIPQALVGRGGARHGDMFVRGVCWCLAAVARARQHFRRRGL